MQVNDRQASSYNAPPAPQALAAQLGFSTSALIKLDANENPYGPPPAATAALASSARSAHRYPDPDASELRVALSGYTGYPPESIVVGNGSDELIDLLCRHLLRPGDNVVTCPPTFSLYALAAEQAGAAVLEAPRGSAGGTGFSFDADAVAATVDERTKIIFLCSPNNPTGDVIGAGDVRRVLGLGPLVVLDEAYVEFSGSNLLGLTREYGNLVVLRTFSKAFGLAGLRIGYGVFPDDLAQSLRAAKLPYNVNALAQAAALGALRDLAWVEERAAMIRAERDRLFLELGAMPGLAPLPSAANFLLVRIYGPHSTRGLRGLQARQVYEALLRRGIMVRHFDRPPLHDYLRISTGSTEQNDALLAAMRAILEQGET